jgi:hypothetical protein
MGWWFESHAWWCPHFGTKFGKKNPSRAVDRRKGFFERQAGLLRLVGEIITVN